MLRSETIGSQIFDCFDFQLADPQIAWPSMPHLQCKLRTQHWSPRTQNWSPRPQSCSPGPRSWGLDSIEALRWTKLPRIQKNKFEYVENMWNVLKRNIFSTPKRYLNLFSTYVPHSSHISHIFKHVFSNSRPFCPSQGLYTGFSNRSTGPQRWSPQCLRAEVLTSYISSVSIDCQMRRSETVRS